MRSVVEGEGGFSFLRVGQTIASKRRSRLAHRDPISASPIGKLISSGKATSSSYPRPKAAICAIIIDMKTALILLAVALVAGLVVLGSQRNEPIDASVSDTPPSAAAVAETEARAAAAAAKA